MTSTPFFKVVLATFCNSTRTASGILQKQLFVILMEEETVLKVPRAENDTHLFTSIKELVIFITNRQVNLGGGEDFGTSDLWFGHLL
jgi:hypothetical protein